MRTRITPILLAILATAALGGPSDAKAKKKAAPKPKVVVEKEAPKADAQAVTALMGPYKWGMTLDLTLEALEIQLNARYKERMERASNDKYQMNNLRKEIKAEVLKVKKSLTKFEGSKGGGWDVSIIEREFGQKNDEEMLISKEYDPDRGIDQQRFFFFVDGKLWKMFVSFDLAVFEGKGFPEFREMMEARFGKAAPHELPRADGGVDVDYVYWKGGGANLRAIDLTRFYGSFALAISEEKTEDWIFKRRAERNPLKPPTGTVVDSVMEDPNNKDPNLTQENSDVIDRITKEKKDQGKKTP